jgi:hypothetical protein
VGGQPGLPLHRDGSLLSFSVLLSRAHEGAFAGGGTRFPHLAHADNDDDDAGCAHAGATSRDVADAHGVVRLAQGDACVHSGGVLHGGEAVTAGRRLLLVGFVDSARPRSAAAGALAAPAKAVTVAAAAA